ncbi:alpha/beta hydrolase [Phenylobacterium sp.]|jgi:pimeloyl-ACP methyl ester carboxylesterase|uniref:alpha/beta fold hydrolase n=1 Tax=Phenylobacterium sp. TaxID=1871053 RepID=UPI002F3ECDBB
MRGLRLLGCGALAALAMAAAAPSRAAPATPAATIASLDAFDAQKKSVVLPNGLRLAYVEMGNPKGRPVVLIHGYTDNARDWWPLTPYLDKSFRLIIVDIRGHGGSGKPECCYTRVDFAYDIKLLLDALKIDKADIVGHSLGSIITQTFAELWPERTARVVLVSSTGGPRKAAKTGVSTAPAPPAFDFRSAIVKLRDPIDPDSPFMVAWWSSPTPVDEAFIQRQRQDAAKIPVKVWLAVLDQGLEGVDLQATLPKLKAPTLLIWGGKDQIIDMEGRETLREGLPAATVKVFEQLGHNPFWEDAPGVAAEINRFLGHP